MLLNSINHIYLIVFLLLSSTTLFSQSWYIIDPTSISGTPDFSDVFFTDDNIGWITSSSHAGIYHTSNGGLNFEIQTTQLTSNAIHMLNANEGYSGGASGFIYDTDDGGQNWPFFGTMVSTLADISFPPTGDTGYACGINGNIYAITTSPNTVTKMTSGVPDNLYSLSFPVVSSEGWVCGGSIIRHYVNNAWTASDQDYPSGGYNAIYFVDNSNGWVVGDSGVIAHTTDGKNWTAQTNPSSNTLYDVFFLNTQEGWAVGLSGTILHTTNGGNTWNIVASGVSTASLNGVHFTSNTNGYVVGNGKTLIKYGLPLATKDDESVPRSFSLAQNYPNPFNPTTTIGFSIDVEIIVNLIVYDILGNEVAILLNDVVQVGEHKVAFNANELPNGIYYYKLIVGNEQQTKKLLLMK